MINFNRKVSHFLLSRRLVNPNLNFGLKIPIQNTRKGIVNPNFKLNPFVKPTPGVGELISGVFRGIPCVYSCYEARKHRLMI